MNTFKSNSFNRIPWQVYVAAVAVLPSVGVLTARTMLPSRGPRSASAAEPIQPSSGPSAIRATKAEQLSTQDAAFLELVASSASQPVAQSPIARRQGRGVRVDKQTPSTSKSFSVEPALRATETSVTSILKSNGQLIAMIGGKLRRVGDRLSDGWSIKEIDADEGTVMLVHVSGHTKTLSLRSKQ